VLFADGELAARCRDDGLPVEVVNLRSAYDPAGPRRLGRLFAQHGVRLVHVHGYKAAVNVALAPGRFGMVATLHGQGEPTWRRARVFLKDRFYRALEVWACRRRRAAVCFVTADLQRRHGGRYGRLPLATVPNGIEPLDRGAFAERPAGLADDRLHALMVGRLTPVKGIGFMLEALARLEPGHPWQLDLVGDGPRRGELEAQAAQLGVADRVTFHGFRRDAHALLAHGDLLVMSSLHEGLPYTLLEAMSLGLPTLASDVGGLAEVLRHEETGLLVPVGDVGDLAAALDRLGRDGELRQALGRRAAMEQRRAYTLEAMGEGYLQVYAAVAGA
jgi:glycosyltransferase involved in cell wall biosynthesis